MDPFTRKESKASCLLGIEVSGDFCSVAVNTDRAVLSKKSLHMPYGQAGYLMGMIHEVLEEADLKWKDLSGVVVNRGPGSFTGIRVGLATAQGISLAGEIPLFGLTGFNIYRSLIREEKLLVLIDTRRDDCFASFFEPGSLNSSFSKVMSYEEIDLFSQSHSDLCIGGNLSSSYFENRGEFYLLEADHLLHSFYFYQDQNPAIFSSEPYYLREPEVHGKQTSI
jgi:tRNA threonylcarbamoyl adenosine modification protein YeaZ